MCIFLNISQSCKVFESMFSNKNIWNIYIFIFFLFEYYLKELSNLNRTLYTNLPYALRCHDKKKYRFTVQILEKWKNNNNTQYLLLKWTNNLKYFFINFSTNSAQTCNFFFDFWNEPNLGCLKNSKIGQLVTSQ